MMTVVEFLLARIAEDEELARAATGPGETVYADRSSGGAAALAHIARHDPARVLAECEAKRRIVEEAARIDSLQSAMAHELELESGLLFAVYALGAVYADHPDYREDWRP